MTYAELLPTLLHKGYCTTRPGKPPPNPLPPRFRSDLRCDFHQGALGHDIQSLMNDNYLIASDVCVIMPVFHDTPIKSTPLKENVEPLVIRLPGLVPYVSTKAIPYKYNATMVENGIEVPLVPPRCSKQHRRRDDNSEKR